jgi:hypothetical protein
MKNLILCTLLSMGLTSTKAQDIAEPVTMGGGGFTIGYGYMDISALEKFIPRRFGGLNATHVVIGGTGHGVFNNFVLGGTGYAMIGDAVSNDSLKYSAGGGAGTLDIGYVVFNRQRVKIYPLMGIGGFGYGLQVSKSRNFSASQLSENPAQEININQGGFAMDVSVQVNIIPAPEYDELERSYGGFMTGLRIGYTCSVPGSSWNYSGGAITDGPKFGLGLVYAKLIIGGFGYKGGAGSWKQ